MKNELMVYFMWAVLASAFAFTSHKFSTDIYELKQLHVNKGGSDEEI